VRLPPGKGKMKARPDRAIGIVRVSKVGGRESERFLSPAEQRERIEALCEREGLELIDTFDELDVSGGTPLDKRTRGLLPAVEAIENKRAKVLVCAYFDRLVRSMKVQLEVVERVEAVGGRVLTADFGAVTDANGTAVQQLTGGMMGLISQFLRRSTGERLASAQLAAIEQGRWPVTLIAGLRRDRAGQVVLDPNTAPAVTEAFRMRADRARIADVRAHLRANGIVRSFHGTQALLSNRQAIGEIKFGEHRGTIPALIDVRTFERVQRMILRRGVRSKSNRLLARLDVLRCANCGGRMVVGTQTQNGRSYSFYRCGHVRADCSARPTIGAELVEREVVAVVKRLLRERWGSAAEEVDVREAQAVFDRAQASLDSATRTFEGLGLEGEAAIERLRELRDARDAARERFEQMDDAHGVRARAIVGARDWDDLSFEGQRKLIQALIESVTVRAGAFSRVGMRLAASERITITPKGPLKSVRTADIGAPSTEGK
jgi:DNA invertase Pin-like site-specific DNA recombinase